MRKAISNGVLCILMNISAFCLGQAGRLDPSFSGDGRVVTNFPGGGQPAVDARAFGVAIQSDGRIVAAGFSGNNFALTRYNTDGTLDTSFSGDGRVITSFGSDAQARAVAIDSAGRIVAVGFAGNDFALARYNADGTLDTSFGNNGRVITDFGGTDQANAVALQTIGGEEKIVAVGFATVGNESKFALARYNANGTLDPSFGTNGRVITDSGSDAQANAVTIQADGRIVVVGFETVNNRDQFLLVRYDANGTTSARQVATFGGITARANAVVIDVRSDRIFAAGFAGNNFALAQFNATTLSIGVTDQIITSLGARSQANAVVLQSDFKIIAAGFRGNNFAVVRYNDDGRTLDTTFGNNGRVFTNFGGTDVAQAAAIDSAGRLVVAGFSVISGRGRFALARYLIPSATPIPTFVTITSATPPDGSTIGAGTAESLEGTASAGSTVTVFDSSNSGEFVAIGTTSVDGTSNWKFKAEGLALGKHIFVAAITDSDGQTVSKLSNTVTITVVERAAGDSAWLQAISDKYCKNCR